MLNDLMLSLGEDEMGLSLPAGVAVVAKGAVALKKERINKF